MGFFIPGDSQIRELLEMAPKEATEDLRAAIRKLRDEELEHRDTAIENDATRAPAYRFLSSFIQTGCRTSIFLVSKI